MRGRPSSTSNLSRASATSQGLAARTSTGKPSTRGQAEVLGGQRRRILEDDDNGFLGSDPTVAEQVPLADGQHLRPAREPVVRSPTARLRDFRSDSPFDGCSPPVATAINAGGPLPAGVPRVTLIWRGMVHATVAGSSWARAGQRRVRIRELCAVRPVGGRFRELVELLEPVQDVADRNPAVLPQEHPGEMQAEDLTGGQVDDRRAGIPAESGAVVQQQLIVQGMTCPGRVA